MFVELEVNFFLLRRLLGVRTQGSEKQSKVAKLTKGEVLMRAWRARALVPLEPGKQPSIAVSIWSMSTGA